jgi:hypothetical protein
MMDMRLPECPGHSAEQHSSIKGEKATQLARWEKEKEVVDRGVAIHLFSIDDVESDRSYRNASLLAAAVGVGVWPLQASNAHNRQPPHVQPPRSAYVNKDPPTDPAPTVNNTTETDRAGRAPPSAARWLARSILSLCFIDRSLAGHVRALLCRPSPSYLG